jgi:hypothetical protein
MCFLASAAVYWGVRPVAETVPSKAAMVVTIM